MFEFVAMARSDVLDQDTTSGTLMALCMSLRSVRFSQPSPDSISLTLLSHL